MLLAHKLDRWPRQRITFERDPDYPELWYLEVCVLKFQISFYCREMGERIIWFINNFPAVVTASESVNPPTAAAQGPPGD